MQRECLDELMWTSCLMTEVCVGVETQENIWKYLWQCCWKTAVMPRRISVADFFPTTTTWQRQSGSAWQCYVVFSVTEWQFRMAMAQITIPHCTHLRKEA